MSVEIRTQRIIHLHGNMPLTQSRKTTDLLWPQHSISINCGSVTVVSTKSPENLEVIADNKLSFADHIFISIRLHLSGILHQKSQTLPLLPVQASVISRVDYCNVLLTNLPSYAKKKKKMKQHVFLMISQKGHNTTLIRLCTGSQWHRIQSSHSCGKSSNGTFLREQQTFLPR